MRKLRDVPIKQKLIVILLATIAAALLVAGFGIIAFDLVLFRQAMQRDLSALTRIMAEINTAALAFDDPASAQETLAALKARPHVEIVCIFRNDGTELARYARPRETGACPPPAPREEIRFNPGDVTVRQPVMLDGRQVGTLSLVYDLAEIAERRRLYGATVLGVLILASAVAFLVTSRMRATIVTPISHLARTAAAVAATRDYSLRAQKTSEDELGLLTDAFNQMLARIQSDDAELRAAKEELEARVAERTRELESQTAELARSNHDLQQFAYVASHDLQEPLRMVFSYMTIIAEQYTGKLDAEADEFIGYAIDGARRMRQLITDLLEYSRLGSRNADLVPTDCAEILQAVRTNLEVNIEETGAVITHDALPVVLAESSQLTRLLQNLVANAIKFHGAERPRVHISAVREGAWWKFAIADNGIGIAAEYHERIFVIFQRLHDRMTYAGTGMGLAICNKIVSRLGGRIWVESVPGEGSTFYFTVPAKTGGNSEPRDIRQAD